jgi:Patatin-like phospholipase
MPKRLAITIAGAVSLGSYEAGVLYEVLTAIKQHNSTATPDNRICIDVLTGASAGGMTALILGQKLLYSGSEFKSAYDNPLYNTWVKTISLAGLQNTQNDEPPLHSLFSSDLIEKISSDVVTGRYKTNPLPPASRHPAAADTIHLGVALTNLDGVNFGYDVKPDGKFVYIDYGDQMTAVADGAASDNQAFWKPLSQAAVACGAFPFAFRSKDLMRNRSEYSKNNLEPWPADPRTFTYSDGGILQNQPLGMAKNLVDEIDPHETQNERYYMFVSPNAKDTTANDNFHEANADYVQLLKRLVGVVLGQSSFHDWITAEDFNKRIALLDLRAAGLRDALNAGTMAAQPLAETADGLLKLFFPGGSHVPPGATQPETLVDAQSRIAVQYASEMQDLGGATPKALAFRDAVLAFETAAGLGARDHMEIYGVTAKDTELAGAGLCAFLGFFDQKFRDHDYDVGRQHARDFLTSPALSAAGAIGPINYPNKEDIHPIDHRLDGLKLKDVPPGDMNAFKDGLRHRVNQMLKALMGGWSIAVDPLADALVNVTINQLVLHM